MGFLPSADEIVITLKTKNLVGERDGITNRATKARKGQKVNP